MYVPIGNAELEIHPNDAIVEAPSLVTPLLLKKGSPLNNDGGDHEISAQASNNNKTVDDYVKSTAVASLTNQSRIKGNSSILSIDDYYQSSVGQLLIGIGLSRVREYNLADNVKRLTSKIRRNGDKHVDLIGELESLRSELVQTRTSNKPFVPQSNQKYKCPKCPFESEFSVVMDGHLEVPHVNKKEYLCNWCAYKIRDANQIVFHTFVAHKKRSRVEKPISMHSCEYCSYEARTKKKLANHIERCVEFFPHATVQGPQDYGAHDYPAITSKFITKNDIQTYEQTLKALRLAAYNPHQLKMTNTNYTPLYIIPGKTNANLNGRNRILGVGILQNPKTPLSSFINGKTVTATADSIIAGPTKPTSLPGRSESSTANCGESIPTNFVICEICDGYIKDLSQLKSHMQCIHKVRIHQKILESRPPLSCQKCNWRYFTDSGLERHLLAAHGLVTSNMQDQVDQGTDSGRCSICGRVYSSKLVAHTRDVHKSNLKPAALSYKCTVCSATFSLYRLFENHIYSVHGDSLRRPTTNVK